MSETITAHFRVLVRPDGEYEFVHGSGPLSWIGPCLEQGCEIHTVEVDLPVPPRPPHLIGRLTERKAR